MDWNAAGLGDDPALAVEHGRDGVLELIERYGMQVPS